MYYGIFEQCIGIFKNQINKYFVGGRFMNKFFVVCMIYEMVICDCVNFFKINWEFIIIDEGYWMKNFDFKLFWEFKIFIFVICFLIIGIFFQNNFKELWLLLNFLLFKIFSDWEFFESWFDFSDFEDEEGIEEFIVDKVK